VIIHLGGAVVVVVLLFRETESVGMKLLKPPTVGAAQSAQSFFYSTTPQLP